MARGEVATAHYDAIPRSAVGGEMAVLRQGVREETETQADPPAHQGSGDRHPRHQASVHDEPDLGGAIPRTRERHLRPPAD